MYFTMIAHTSLALDIIELTTLGIIDKPLVDHAWWGIVMSGMLARWIMDLLSWLVAANRDIISQILIIWLVITTVDLSQLHHSIVGTIEMFAAMFADYGFCHTSQM